MQFVILDLEWNGSYSRRRKKFINEIIEFGAVKLSCDLHITETFSMLVNPQVGKKLTTESKRLHISVMKSCVRSITPLPMCCASFVCLQRIVCC